MKLPWYGWWIGVVLAAAAGVHIALRYAPTTITVPAAAEPAASKPAPWTAPSVMAAAPQAGRKPSIDR